ncbi:hypothetical protein FRB95_011291 [Tulasnella sp. JGI-2019a]|nr:hypothetical protein FRB95_011291 [Tulasnella sp. JGI-2019a]
MRGLLLSRRAVQPAWEVVDHTVVAPVPADFGEADVVILFIAPRDVSKTYTFDAPFLFQPALDPEPSSSSNGILPRIKRLSGSWRRQRPPLTDPAAGRWVISLSGFKRNRTARSRSGSTSSSYSTSTIGPESYLTMYESSSYSSFGHRTLSRSTGTRGALILARDQLLHSSVLESSGGNVLLYEGWAVTRLRRGCERRLQVQYYGRPALVVGMGLGNNDPILPRTTPPFLDILEDTAL